MRDCNQCGKCCIKYGDGGIIASAEEIDAWAEHQPEIYAYVRGEEIWFDPTTGRQLSRCPFLELLPNAALGREKYGCRIYQHRPEDCRHYPTNIDEMRRDNCEMLQPFDLVNPRAAQRALDRLMADSRPPLDD